MVDDCTSCKYLGKKNKCLAQNKRVIRRPQHYVCNHYKRKLPALPSVQKRCFHSTAILMNYMKCEKAIIMHNGAVVCIHNKKGCIGKSILIEDNQNESK